MRMHVGTTVKTAVLATVAVVAVSSSVACGQLGQVRAMMRFKEANLAYQSADYARAIPLYEQTVQNDPNLTSVYFFLGNSYDNLYQPGSDDPANKENLNKAIQNYEIAAEKIPTDTPENAKLKMLSLQYLAAAYGPDKLDAPVSAAPVIRRMINLNPRDVSSYFSLSKLYEDAGAFAEAEQMLLYAKDVKPNDSGVYMQLARYYNTQGEFAKTIEALEQRAKLEPDNPEAFFTISTYYWDNAQRNLRLADAEKMAHVKSGLAAVDRALQIRPDYMEALVYKGLLLRTQANIEKDPDTQQALLKEAIRLQTEADELRKKKAAGLAGN
jgi:tetratricopeptide (TPR) repeat protein